MPTSHAISAGSGCPSADNRATYHAGGLYAALGTLTVTGSTFTANIAGFRGAAIYNDRNTLTLANTTLAENLSGLFGGALFHDGGTATLVNGTLVDNYAQTGGGRIALGRGTVALSNTIVARNGSLFAEGDCDGPVTSLGHNVIGDPTGCTIALQPTDLVGDPGLAAYVDDGMPGRGHHPPLPDSLVINAGDDTACPATDQLGNHQVGRCDIGAVEFQPPRQPPSLAMRLSQHTFGPRETLRMDLTLRNPGPMLTTDVYVGAVLPDGKRVLWLTDLHSKAGVVTPFTATTDPRTFAPLLRGVNWPAGLDAVQQDYLTHRFSGFEAPGSYTLIVGLTKPNSLMDGRIDEGDVLALAWDALWFTGGATPQLHATMQAIQARLANW